MITKILQQIKHLIANRSKKEVGSKRISDPGILKKYTDDPDFPFLISFPRTGSHWLRMMMELYFEKPSLVRIFYYENATDFLCFHRHDTELDIERRNVLYLYRDPIDTIYSQLNYYKQKINNKKKIQYWSELYGKHLNKWLLEEKFTQHKTIITYEGLRKDLPAEFKKICKQFNTSFNAQRLNEISNAVSKEKLEQKTQHDKQVVNLTSRYQELRAIFRKAYGEYIINCVLAQNKELSKFI